MRLIDADLLKKEVLGLSNCYNGFSDTYDKACIIGVIDEQPTISPKTGRWIKVGDNAWKCSYCSEISCCESPYCGECGAKMEEVTE